jgi:hypothetical protein
VTISGSRASPHFEIVGTLTVTDPKFRPQLRGLNPYTICLATAGPGVLLDGDALCNRFDRSSGFSEEDSVRTESGHISFSVSRSYDPNDTIHLSEEAGAALHCSPAATFIIEAASGETLTGASSLPDFLSPKRIELSPSEWT